jgi:hypothetical protein
MSDDTPGGLTDFTNFGDVDPAVESLLSTGRRRRQEARLPLKEKQKLARERKKSKTRRGRRAVYDLDPALIAAVKEIAAQHRVPASQVAAVLLLQGLTALEAGELDLEALKEPSDSPRFEWNLDLSWAELFTKS